MNATSQPIGAENMTEGTTCYERDEVACDDQMCLRTGCRIRNDRFTSGIPKPYFVASECGNDPCTEQWCPYTHGSGWKIDGVEGLFNTQADAIAALTLPHSNPDVRT